MSTTPLGPVAGPKQTPMIPIRRSPEPSRRRVDVSQHFVALANRLIALRRTDLGIHGKTESGSSRLLGKSIGIASCRSKGGASTVAANVAIATTIAVEGEVLLIETSPRRRSRLPGWSEFNRGEARLDELLIESDVSGLVRLPAGSADGPTLIDPARVKQMVRGLKSRFEWIFFDLPYADSLTQCYPIASALDGVVLVVPANKVATPQVIRIAQEIDQAGANLVGVVLNKKRRYAPKWLSRMMPFLAEPE